MPFTLSLTSWTTSNSDPDVPLEHGRVGLGRDVADLDPAVPFLLFLTEDVLDIDRLVVRYILRCFGLGLTRFLQSRSGWSGVD